MKLYKTVISLLVVMAFCTVSPAKEKKEYESEKNKKSIISSNSDTWQFVPIPVVAYMPETSLVGSLALTAYSDREGDNKKDDIMLSFYYTLKNQLGFSFLGNKYLNNHTVKLSTELNASKFPTKYYGIGNDVKKCDEETFESRNIGIIPSFMLEIYKNFYAGVLLNFYTDRLKDMEEDRELTSGSVKGSEGISQLGAGIVIDYDTRDSFSYPHKGVLYSFKWKSFNKHTASDYSFNYLFMDLKNYFRIKGDHVIGLNARYEMTLGSVPFQLLPLLGGSNVMRGFVQDKYRDKHYAALQTEYRFPLFWRIGAAVFASAGDVAPDASGFKFQDIKTAGGCGIRVNLDRKQHINLRFDLAYNSDGEMNLYMNLLEAF